MPPKLLPHHEKRLRRTLSEDWIAARGAFSATTPEQLAELGASPAQQALTERGPVLVYPGMTPSGVSTAMLRPDVPRIIEDKITGKESAPRWEALAGRSAIFDVPPRCRPYLDDTSTPVIFAEGKLKGDVTGKTFEEAGIPVLVLGLNGVYGWKAAALKHEWEHVALAGRHAIILFDSDIVVNANVLQAARGLAAFLQSRGAASVRYIVLPDNDGAKQDIEDFIASGGTYSQLLELLRDDPLPTQEEVVWRDPLEPETQIVAPGPFPIDVLPELNRRIAVLHAESRGAPIDVAVVPHLAVPGAAAQQAFEISINPSFVSPTGLQIVLSAERNSGKGIIDEFRRRLRRWEAEQKAAVERQQRGALANLALLESRLKNVQNQMRKRSDDSGLADEFKELFVEVEAAKKAIPKPRDILVDGVTTEAWGVLLDGNFGCWTMIDSEGGGLVDILSGRYSAQLPDVNILLRSFRGEPYKVTRISRPGIDQTSIRGAACVAIQPVVAEKWFYDEWLDLRGVLNRMIFVSVPARTKPRLIVPEQWVPPALAAEFDEVIRALLSLAENVPVDEHGEPVRKAFSFTDAGLDLITEYGSSLADRAGEFGDLHPILGHLERLIPDMVVRLAVALHLWRWANDVVSDPRRTDPLRVGERPDVPLKVPDDRVRDALRVTAWTIDHRRSLVAKMDVDWTVAGLARLRRLLVKHGELLIDDRTILQALKGSRSRITTRQDLDKLLREACKLGWVARIRGTTDRQVLAVNPQLLDGASGSEIEDDFSEIDLDADATATSRAGAVMSAPRRTPATSPPRM